MVPPAGMHTCARATARLRGSTALLATPYGSTEPFEGEWETSKRMATHLKKHGVTVIVLGSGKAKSSAEQLRTLASPPILQHSLFGDDAAQVARRAAHTARHASPSRSHMLPHLP